MMDRVWLWKYLKIHTVPKIRITFTFLCNYCKCVCSLFLIHTHSHTKGGRAAMRGAFGMCLCQGSDNRRPALPSESPPPRQYFNNQEFSGVNERALETAVSVPMIDELSIVITIFWFKAIGTSKNNSWTLRVSLSLLSPLPHWLALLPNPVRTVGWNSLHHLARLDGWKWMTLKWSESGPWGPVWLCREEI